MTLLYAVTGGLPAYVEGQIAFFGDDPFLVSLGYVFTQLSYVLLVAGVWSGKFGVFRLRKRTHTFLVAILAWLIGVLLVNHRFWLT